MNKDELLRAGIDYDSGVHRFAGKPQIYEKYLLKFFTTNEFPVLRKALESKNYDAAFAAAHNIKGGVGNLSLTDCYSKISELVEALRAGVHDDSLLVLCSEAEKFYSIAKSAVKE